MVFCFWMGVNVHQLPQPAGVSITSPVPGEALQGIVTITGTSASPGFSAADVSFAYSQGNLGGWFFIQESHKPVVDGTLTNWDTTTITDGVYDLRLTVTLSDGSSQQVLVPGVRVRNYTQIETDTPLPTATINLEQTQPSPTSTQSPEVTATALKLTPTLLPENPAVVGGHDILVSLAGGGLVVVGLFLVGGLYLGLKNLIRR